MFEEYIGKKVKIYATIGDRPFSFEGTVLAVSDTHLKLLDKFNKEQLILLESIEQATPLQEAAP